MLLDISLIIEAVLHCATRGLDGVVKLWQVETRGCIGRISDRELSKIRRYLYEGATITDVIGSSAVWRPASQQLDTIEHSIKSAVKILSPWFDSSERWTIKAGFHTLESCLRSCL